MVPTAPSFVFSVGELGEIFSIESAIVLLS
jgi:hypothetical protein